MTSASSQIIRHSSNSSLNSSFIFNDTSTCSLRSSDIAKTYGFPSAASSGLSYHVLFFADHHPCLMHGRRLFHLSVLGVFGGWIPMALWNCGCRRLLTLFSCTCPVSEELSSSISSELMVSLKVAFVPSSCSDPRLGFLKRQREHA